MPQARAPEPSPPRTKHAPPPAYATPTLAARPLPDAQPSAAPPPVLGVSGDVGTPDGLIAALVLRPAAPLRLHVGGGTNSATGGFRGGLSILPFGAGPSLSLEGGHYSAADTNGLVRGFVGAFGKAATLFNRMSYTYFNAHLGLDFGSRYVTFYLHGGVSYVLAHLYNVNQALDDMIKDPEARTRVTLDADPTIRALIPSIKAGLILFLP